MWDEHASTFEWILRTWLEGVGNNPPLTIITDQDQAMASAIAVVLPNTIHLLCSWHISQKFPEKLAHYYSVFPEFKTDFNHCIYNSPNVFLRLDVHRLWKSITCKSING